MIRTLLADRFKLVMHADRREMPIYTMTMASAAAMPAIRLPLRTPEVSLRLVSCRCRRE